MLPDFEAWAIFAKVAERGSFSAAARELGLSNATVSKAVARLETRLGTALLHRTSRRLSLTASGEATRRRAAELLSSAQAIEEGLAESDAAPRGRIRMTAPMSFGVRHLGVPLSAFMAKWQDIAVDLTLSDARLDIVGEGIDVAVRIGALADSSLRARQLRTVRRPVVGSPAYFASRGIPSHPRDLARHRAIVYAHLEAPARWRFTHPEAGEVHVTVDGHLTVNNGDIATDALLAGIGIAVQPDFFIAPHIRDGRLVEVLSDWSAPPIALYLVTPPGRIQPKRVRLLIEALSAAFRGMP